MLDLFCGRFGWSRAFAARGWECVGVDLVEPPEIPQGCSFFNADVLNIRLDSMRRHLWFNAVEVLPWNGGYMPDFICASSPCEQFSVHGIKCFHPNPPYPELGIKLFEHTRAICEASGVPYIMENVRSAQKFVGNAAHHCGPYYLWGNAVPAILPQGIQKGTRLGKSGFTGEAQREWRRKNDPSWNPSKSKARQEMTAKIATIPPELANCVADYAERLLELTNSKQEISGEGPIPSGQSSESKSVDKNAS